MDSVVARLEWGVFKALLKAPYQLSFVTLEAYEGVWVRCVRDDGLVGIGEAVPLPGYGSETLEDVRRVVGALAQDAVGQRVEDLAQRVREAWRHAPFAASAVMSALEFPFLLSGAPRDREFPLNLPVAGDSEPRLLQKRIEEGFAQGYRFIKVKVGKSSAQELDNIPVFFEKNANLPFRALFDANQGFTYDEALLFATELAKRGTDRLCWLEQPLGRHDWDGHARLCAATACPVLLDESIYSAQDVRRAASIGAAGVKLKLFKHCGPRHCLELAALAKSLGLLVVFGNGVATDIGNLTEHLVLSCGDFSSPAESNGFCKLTRPVLTPSLTVRNGKLARSDFDQGEFERLITTFPRGEA